MLAREGGRVNRQIEPITRVLGTDLLFGVGPGFCHVPELSGEVLD